MRIKELRLKNKWTQQKIANKLGVSIATVSRWESHKSKPDILKLLDLASIFGVKIDELYSDFEKGENDKTTNKK